MCMKIVSEITIDKPIAAWKVFRETKSGTLKPLFYSYQFSTGVWLRVSTIGKARPFYPVGAGGDDYVTSGGFHCFDTKKEAVAYIARWGHGLVKEVIKKVKIKGMAYRFHDHGYRGYAAEWLLIP